MPETPDKNISLSAVVEILKKAIDEREKRLKAIAPNLLPQYVSSNVVEAGQLQQEANDLKAEIKALSAIWEDVLKLEH
jgi:hypothetical protein